MSVRELVAQVCIDAGRDAAIKDMQRKDCQSTACPFHLPTQRAYWCAAYGQEIDDCTDASMY